MTKRQAEFDMQNPFIPAHSPVCRLADTALIFSVVAVSLAAVVTSLINQIGGL
ncbi:MAG: hypothetical protein ACOH2J_18215 [Allorhizobium sp.]